MVAYSFQNRFVDHVQAGLEPGPWCPGMKRHTLRKPREGRSRHARPEQTVQLYTAMRTRHCRMIGKAVCRVQIPVTLMTVGKDWPMVLMRRSGAAPRSRISGLAPVVQEILDTPIGGFIAGERMEEFARTDGFRDVAEMLAFFEAPEVPAQMDLVLVGWSPGDLVH